MSGSARLRWVSEDSEHRRPATRQRGFCGSSLKQPVPDFSKARMAAENRPLEIVRDARSLPAPAQSTEPKDFMGFSAVCQFSRSPLKRVLRADPDAPRRHNGNRVAGRVRQRIDFIAAVHAQRAAAEEKKGNVRAEVCGNFHQSLERQLFPSQTQHSYE